MSLKVLSVRQPWATAILHMGKDVENRVWKTQYRGELYIHASLYKPKPKDFEALAQILGTSAQKARNKFYLCGSSDYYGYIIGKVYLDNIINDSQSIWGVSTQYHWLISSPEVLDNPIPAKGKLGIWSFPSYQLKNFT